MNIGYICYDTNCKTHKITSQTKFPERVVFTSTEANFLSKHAHVNCVKGRDRCMRTPELERLNVLMIILQI